MSVSRCNLFLRRPLPFSSVHGSFRSTFEEVRARGRFGFRKLTISFIFSSRVVASPHFERRTHRNRVFTRPTWRYFITLRLYTGQASPSKPKQPKYVSRNRKRKQAAAEATGNAPRRPAPREHTRYTVFDPDSQEDGVISLDEGAPSKRFKVDDSDCEGSDEGVCLQG